jgi:site-specific DNA-methyltransferase (cytosine-N4-specific)
MKSSTKMEDHKVHLMITSPPYPMIKMWDNQFRQLDERINSLWNMMESEKNIKKKEEYLIQIYERMHEYLAQVWKETFRVLVDGGIACINIGDATRSINGRFRLFPNHSKVIEHCEKIGFTTLPFILWQKPTTKPKYKGKGAFLGSGMLPPNAYVTQDCEFILIFRKGNLRKFKPHDPLRYESRYTKEERDVWFSQIWQIVGTKQKLTEVERRSGAFPEEIPRRLIKMFSIKGDTVLDPFLGTGTTTLVAKELERNSIGYEIDKSLLPVIKNKIGYKQKDLKNTIEIIE